MYHRYFNNSSNYVLSEEIVDPVSEKIEEIDIGDNRSKLLIYAAIDLTYFECCELLIKTNYERVWLLNRGWYRRGTSDGCLMQYYWSTYHCSFYIL